MKNLSLNRRLMCEQLENRRYCAISITHNPTTHVTEIKGTPGDDRVLVARVTGEGSNENYRITTNDNQNRIVPFGTIMFYGYAGNDILDATQAIHVVKAWGGAGNDIITTGNKNDSLSGGDGRDTLKGNAGNDWYFANLGNGQGDGDADHVDMRDGQSIGDRNQNPEAIDDVMRDAAQDFQAHSVIQSHENTVQHYGRLVTMRDDPGAFLYSRSFNNQPATHWRAANRIGVYAYTFEIDASLRSELNAQHWLNFNQLG